MVKLQSYSPQHNVAFTLAEVLITLGIIGVVAAMTLPTIINNSQKIILKNQFKKAYSTFFNAIKLSQSKNEGPFACYYWATGNMCRVECAENDPVYNTCTRYTCQGGAPLPANNSGQVDDCLVFENELFVKTMKVAKYCKDNALANGCITNDYRGSDKVIAENNPSAPFPPNPSINFSDSNIKNRYSVWVLVDGTVIIKNGSAALKQQTYAIDVNGHKKPNKWGYDIFTFKLLGDTPNGITSISGVDYVTERGGISSLQIVKEAFK